MRFGETFSFLLQEGVSRRKLDPQSCAHRLMNTWGGSLWWLPGSRMWTHSVFKSQYRAESWFFRIMSNLLRFRPLLSSVSGCLDECLVLPQCTPRSVENTPFQISHRRALVVYAACPGALGERAPVPPMPRKFERPGIPVVPIQSILGDSISQPQHCWHSGWLILCWGWWDWGSCLVIVGCSSALDFYSLEASGTLSPGRQLKMSPRITKCL